MSDAMENTRIAYLDVAKFIGIACVVIGHVGSPVDHNAVIAAVHDFVYQFHLPLFFFLSGVFYRKRDTFSQFLKDKLKGLYVPYLISNTILLIVVCIVRSLFGQEFILIDNVKHLVKVSLGLTWTSLAGATWFLLTLLESFVFYDLSERICSKANSRWLLSILMISLAVLLPFTGNLLGHKRTIVAMIFLHCGRLFNNYRSLLAGRIRNWHKYVIVCIAFAFTLAVSKINDIDIATNTYGNYLLFFASSASGIALTLSISSIIGETNAGNLFSSVGRKTIWILSYHFCAFRIVSLIQCLYYGQSLENIMLHPCYIISGAFWPSMYIISGLFLPFIVSKMKIPSI